MKIKSILIANRGEIAIRIMDTARKMGIKTYAIKTFKEPNAWYLEKADEIIDFSDCFDDHVPEFLDIERIIYHAKKYKADAIHPGYGFLAENPDFARRCEEEGIIFIGPSHDARHRRFGQQGGGLPPRRLPSSVYPTSPKWLPASPMASRRQTTRRTGDLIRVARDRGPL